MTYEQEVVVVIPVYKQVPDGDEALALRHSLRILKNYPVVLIGPDDIRFDSYVECGFSREQIQPWPAHHFKDIRAYNRLLCSCAFYSAFRQYRFMLILQADAWVFRDELKEWCDKDYDFIGSPWLWEPERVKKRILIDLWPLLKDQVGNGGVSLRKIRTMIKYGFWAELFFKMFRKNEDFIWLLVSRLPWTKFSKPDTIEALRFCIEMEPQTALEMIGGRLPFSTHAYNRYGRDFWRPLIEGD